MYYFLTDQTGKILARAESDTPLTLATSETIPARTDADGTLGEREYWELRIIGSAPVWTKQTRPLTELEQAQARIEELETALVEVAGLVGGATV